MLKTILKHLQATQIYIIIVLIIFSCGSCQTTRVTQDKLIGTWGLVEDEFDYPRIDFRNDSTAAFFSTGDTVYWYWYQISDNCLYLDSSPVCNKISKLTKDSLVFDNLLEHNKKQHYYRYEEKKIRAIFTKKSN